MYLASCAGWTKAQYLVAFPTIDTVYASLALSVGFALAQDSGRPAPCSSLLRPQPKPPVPGSG
jgi:hypothetical protein